MSELSRIRKGLWTLSNNLEKFSLEEIKSQLFDMGEDLAVEVDKEKKLYFVEICDFEACWYQSVWDNEIDALVSYDKYDLNDSNFEQTKRLGSRSMNNDLEFDENTKTIKWQKAKKLYD